MKVVTFIILTFNEAKTINDCLDSLQGIDASVLVVDSYSTDNTVDIIKNRGISVVQHPFENYSIQRNWAQENNPFKTEWVCHLDADERLTPELVDWIKNDFHKEDNSIDAFIFSRRAVFMGRWIKHGAHYPNYHLRLYRVAKGKCEDKAYDQHFVTWGKSKMIPKKDIINVLSDNLSNFIASHNKWATLEAIEVLKKDVAGKGEVKSRFTGNPIEQRRWLKNNVFQKAPLFLRSFLYFFYRFFIRLGFLDGKEGVVFHILQGFWFRFLVDAKVFEVQQEMKETGDSLETVIYRKFGIKG